MHIGLGPETALAPMSLLQAEMSNVTADSAAEWAAAQASELEVAMTKLIKGEVPPAPFDGLQLVTEG